MQEREGRPRAHRGPRTAQAGPVPRGLSVRVGRGRLLIAVPPHPAAVPPEDAVEGEETVALDIRAARAGLAQRMKGVSVLGTRRAMVGPQEAGLAFMSRALARAKGVAGVHPPLVHARLPPGASQVRGEPRAVAAVPVAGGEATPALPRPAEAPVARLGPVEIPAPQVGSATRAPSPRRNAATGLAVLRPTEVALLGTRRASVRVVRVRPLHAPVQASIGPGGPLGRRAAA